MSFYFRSFKLISNDCPFSNHTHTHYGGPRIIFSNIMSTVLCAALHCYCYYYYLNVLFLSKRHFAALQHCALLYATCPLPQSPHHMIRLQQLSDCLPTSRSCVSWTLGTVWSGRQLAILVTRCIMWLGIGTGARQALVTRCIMWLGIGTGARQALL
jgi:hypothetical protein